MFDAETVIVEVLSRVVRHQRLIDSALGRAESEVTATACPLCDDLGLLVRVANGEIERAAAGDEVVERVIAVTHELSELLFTPILGSAYAAPAAFWSQPGLGQVLAHVQVWLRHDDLIGYTEAARRLFPALAADNVQAARMRIKRLVERGSLMAYVDPAEPNPTKQNRVSRQAVDALAAAGGEP